MILFSPPFPWPFAKEKRTLPWLPGISESSLIPVPRCHLHPPWNIAPNQNSLLFTDAFAEATCWVGSTCSYSTDQWLPAGTALLEAQMGRSTDEHDGIDLCASGHMGHQGGAGVDWQSLWWEFVVSSLKIFENCPIVKEWEQYLCFGVVGTIKQIHVYQEL